VCVIIPAHHEAERIHWVVKGVRRHCADVVVVDDGSSDATAEVARNAGAVVLVHARNRGKGAALSTGFQYAIEQNYDLAITLNGNGRHSPDDIPVFLDAYRRTGFPVIVGNRMGNADAIPVLRRMVNRLATWLLTSRMHGYVPDTQCGFRLYQVNALRHITIAATGRSAVSEILLKLAERSFHIDSVPVDVAYGKERGSFSPLRDGCEFLAMFYRHARRRPRRR
jgi:glycosyltransferase involved in cell wall biosynthesis